jgi:hypothetical protein
MPHVFINTLMDKNIGFHSFQVSLPAIFCKRAAGIFTDPHYKYQQQNSYGCTSAMKKQIAMNMRKQQAVQGKTQDRSTENH